MGAPAEFPQNHLTEMIEMAAQMNRAGGRGVGVASATPLPTVQSAALGRPVPDEPEMSAEERAELDRMAIAAGVKDPRLGNLNPDGSTPDGIPSAYGSLEEAIAAGAPVNQPGPEVEPPNYDQMRAPEYTARALGAVRSTGEHMVARARTMPLTAAPRVPDFRKIEGIDLINNRVIVDGLDFPITETQAAEFKSFCIETVRTVLMEKLDEAVRLFVFQPATAEGTDGQAGGTAADQAVQPE